MTDKFDQWAEEADVYSRMLANMSNLDIDLIKTGLSSDYDVIVSEALDYVITLNITDLVKLDLIQLSQQEQSYLVYGRLRLCKALSNDEELVAALNYNECLDDDLYCQTWECAARVIENRDEKELARLKLFLNETDYTISSLARSLLGYLEQLK